MKFFRLHSELDPKSLCMALDELDAIAISKDFVRSCEEIELANYLAERTFKSKKNNAKHKRYEFLLWLAGKTDIKSAMNLTTPANGEKEFILVIFSNASEKEIISKTKSSIVKLNLEKTANPLEIERISLSRIK